MAEERTITVELSAFEGICLVDAISARLDQLAAGEPTLEDVREVQALYSVIMKMEPQALDMADREEAKKAGKEV